jgi:hypothetical protein
VVVDEVLLALLGPAEAAAAGLHQAGEDWQAARGLGGEEAVVHLRHVEAQQVGSGQRGVTRAALMLVAEEGRHQRVAGQGALLRQVGGLVVGGGARGAARRLVPRQAALLEQLRVGGQPPAVAHEGQHRLRRRLVVRLVVRRAGGGGGAGGGAVHGRLHGAPSGSRAVRRYQPRSR